MTEFLGVALTLAAVALSLPVFVFAVQIWLSGRMPLDEFPGEATARTEQDKLAVAVLMPAHNEAAVIEQTIHALLPLLSPQDRLLVVADNCSDETAALARQAGAEVIERRHDTLRGKGYALDHGVRHLTLPGPPDVLLIMDADCGMSPGGIRRLGALAADSGRPVQALYLMLPPEGADIKLRVAAWAWRL